MRTKIEAVLTPIWLLALSILVTIYLAWGFYYFDIDWMHLLDYVILGKTELWHNFNILMQYLTLTASNLAVGHPYSVSSQGLSGSFWAPVRHDLANA